MNLTRLTSNRRTLGWIDRSLVVVPLLLVGLYGGWRAYSLRDALVVWSCGGNYEFLNDYAAAFEARERCRVRYTAAPVQYLLELALLGERAPDIIVGRAGPGWKALAKADRLESGPSFFAIDPLVIAVAKGNPLGIRDLSDLGRAGVRVAQAPQAMRPKSKVPALLMASVSARKHPGLAERWENNTVSTRECGRNVLEPILRGEADCALVPQTLLHYPGNRGKLDSVRIAPELLLAMKKGRGSMPQCAAVLKTARSAGRDELARQFVDGLTEATELLGNSGYLPLEDPYAQALRPMLVIAVPKDMPALQVELAERLEAYGILPEARRRYLKVVYTFGPNHYTARCLFRAGRLSCKLGSVAAARADWVRVVREYPPSGRPEYDSRAVVAARGSTAVEPLPYENWVHAARTALRGFPPTGARRSETEYDTRLAELFPVAVRDSDPPKNGKREFALGVHLLQAGDLPFATRDLLKTPTLAYPSRFMPDAEYLLGVCASRRGLDQVALGQWERVVRLYPDSPAAALARARLPGPRSDPPNPPPEGVPPMPPWTEAFETHAERGMTYGMRLYGHDLPLFTFKEMVKLLSGVYGPCPFRAEVRYRAGIAAAALGRSGAAAYEWQVCRAHFPGSRWAEEAGEHLAAMSPEVLARAGKPEAPSAAPAGPTAVRLRIAEEFRRAGVYDGDQAVMEYLKVLTVVRPKPLQAARILPRALLGLAVSLERADRVREALAQYKMVLERYEGTRWAPQAAAAAARLTDAGGVDADGGERGEP